MKYIKILLIIFVPIIIFGQDSKISMFDNLTGKIWKAEGNWSDGSKFKQEIEIKYSLDSTIILTNTIGYIDKKQNKIGLRNHGIRQYDKKSDSIRFWEFDVFGGLTTGTIVFEGKNILYQYNYGDSFVTDMWEYVNDSTYNFKVGSYKDGVWKQLYLSTQFKVVEK